MMSCGEIAAKFGVSPQAADKAVRMAIRGLWRNRVTTSYRDLRKNRMKAQYAQICELRRQGKKLVQISNELHINIRTVSRALAAERKS